MEGGSIARKTITSLHETLTYAPSILSKWISKPRRQRHKKQHKTSHGGGKFSQNLHASKNSWYNGCNCKSGRHSRQHTFMHRKSRNKNTSTDNTNLGLKVRGRNKGETKSPSPRRRNQMLHAIYCCQNTNCQEHNNISQPFLPYVEPDLCNNYISKELGNYDCFCINFPCHCVLGHVLSDMDPLNDMNSWKEVVRPTKKPRSIGPHKSKPKKTTNNKKIHQNNKKSRSVTIQIPEKRRSVKIPENPRSVKIPIPESEESRSGKEASTHCYFFDIIPVIAHLHPRGGIRIDLGFNSEEEDLPVLQIQSIVINSLGDK